MCKPWKANGVSTESKEGEKFSDHKRRDIASEQVREELEGSGASAMPEGKGN